MTNLIKKYVPKKHQDKISDFYKDMDGVWLELKEGYVSLDTECGTIHEDTINDVRKKMKTIVTQEQFDKMSRSEINNVLDGRKLIK